LHRGDGVLLGEEPASPPRDHGQVAWRAPGPESSFAWSPEFSWPAPAACPRATSTASTGR
jgi:hypothetical protein